MPNRAIKARGRTSNADGFRRIFDLSAGNFRHTDRPLDHPNRPRETRYGEGTWNLEQGNTEMARAVAMARFIRRRWITLGGSLRTGINSNGAASGQLTLDLLEVPDHDAKHNGGKQPSRQIEHGCKHRWEGFFEGEVLSSRSRVTAGKSQVLRNVRRNGGSKKQPATRVNQAPRSEGAGSTDCGPRAWKRPANAAR